MYHCSFLTLCAAPFLFFSVLKCGHQSHEARKLPKCITIFSMPQINNNFKYIFF